MLSIGTMRDPAVQTLFATTTDRVQLFQGVLCSLPARVNTAQLADALPNVGILDHMERVGRETQHFPGPALRPIPPAYAFYTNHVGEKVIGDLSGQTPFSLHDV